MPQFLQQDRLLSLPCTGPGIPIQPVHETGAAPGFSGFPGKAVGEEGLVAVSCCEFGQDPMQDRISMVGQSSR